MGGIKQKLGRRLKTYQMRYLVRISRLCKIITSGGIMDSTRHRKLLFFMRRIKFDRVKHSRRFPLSYNRIDYET